jgi:glyoxylase I family protein
MHWRGAKEMIHLEAIQHVGVVVTDLKLAVEFYERVLGLKRIPRPDFAFPGAWFAIGNQQLHLLTNEDAETLPIRQGLFNRAHVHEDDPV